MMMATITIYLPTSSTYPIHPLNLFLKRLVVEINTKLYNQMLLNHVMSLVCLNPSSYLGRGDMKSVDLTLMMEWNIKKAMSGSQFY